MQTVIVDGEIRARLHNLTDLLEMRDESGKVLGHYLPLDRPVDIVRALRSCPFSDEELDRRCQETGGRPLAEIWKSLGRQS